MFNYIIDIFIDISLLNKSTKISRFQYLVNNKITSDEFKVNGSIF